MKIEDLKDWYIKNEKLYFVSLELTQQCNFKCKHCYCTGKNEAILDYDIWKEIIDKIAQTECIFLNFTGGEILTHKDFKKIYAYAKDKGFVVELLTNGSLIDEEMISFFKDLPPRNVAITLYGTNEKEYAEFTGMKDGLKKVMKALYLLKENQIKFTLRTIATKTFYDSLKNGSFEEIAKKFEVPFRYDPIIFPQISGNVTPLEERLTAEQIADLEASNDFRKSSWEKLINDNSVFSWKCRAGVSSVAIDFQGNAFVCGLYRKFPISVIESNLESVLGHLRKIHQTHTKIVETNECAKCSNRYICKWCPAYAQIYNSGNESRKIEFLCDLANARMEKFKN